MRLPLGRSAVLLLLHRRPAGTHVGTRQNQPEKENVIPDAFQAANRIT
jgi:hypothetical protein